MRYATLGGGKRLRPFLAIETARALGRTGDAPVRAGAAIECVHAYSLIHDDLPAMDDDDLRRGRPTTHRAFDEATAILAGDALQTLAFEILADPRTDPDAGDARRLCAGLARAAGLAGMVGGQMLDIEAETAAAPLSLEAIARLQAMKTGALLKFSVEAGAHPGRRGRCARARRSAPTAGRSARRSRSPTIFSTPKATRRRWASAPARTPRATRRRSSPRSERRTRAPNSPAWSARRRRRSTRRASATRATACAPPPISSRRERAEARASPLRRATKLFGRGPLPQDGIVRVARRAIAVEGLRIPAVERRAAGEARGQVRVGDEELAERDGVGLGGRCVTRRAELRRIT